MKNPYETLGVKRDASKKDIKSKYRKMAQENHPDKEGGDEEKFKEIAVAYSILSDDDKRKIFDETGNPDKPSIEETASNLIAGAFDEIISDERFTGDIVKQAKKHFCNNKVDCQKKINIINSKVARLLKINGRVKSKSESNIYQSVVEHKMEELNNRLNFENERMLILDKALEIIDDYSDDVPEQESQDQFKGFGIQQLYNLDVN